MKKPFNKINQRDIGDILCMYFNKYPFSDISNTLKISDRGVRRVLQEHGIQTRRKNRYIIRSNYFDVIDNEVQAYILGFLLADGFVGDPAYNNIVVSVAEKDIALLQRISDELVITGISPRQSEDGCYVLNFSDEHMATTLRDFYGFTNNKSIDLQSIFANIPECFKKDVLRGYFDGDGGVYTRASKSSFKKEDGTVSIYEYKYKGISICCTPCVAREIQLFLNMGTIVQTQNSKVVVYYNITKQQDIQTFFELIYQNATIYLERKYNNFI